MVRHKQQFGQLGKLDFLGNYITITHNLYWEQTTRVKIEKVFRIYTRMERCVKQLYVFSLDSFNLYVKAVLKELLLIIVSL